MHMFIVPWLQLLRTDGLLHASLQQENLQQAGLVHWRRARIRHVVATTCARSLTPTTWLIGIVACSLQDLLHTDCLPASSDWHSAKFRANYVFTLLRRDTAATKESAVRAAVAKLANKAASTEMDLLMLQLQAEGSRLGQLGVSSSGLMGKILH